VSTGTGHDTDLQAQMVAYQAGSVEAFHAGNRGFMTRRPIACVLAFSLCGVAAPVVASEVCDGTPRTDARGPAVRRELFAYDAAAPLGV
jgi:hypothetical protein